MNTDIRFKWKDIDVGEDNFSGIEKKMERNYKSLNTLHWKLIRKLSWPKDRHPESTLRSQISSCWCDPDCNDYTKNVLRARTLSQDSKY